VTGQSPSIGYALRYSRICSSTRVAALRRVISRKGDPNCPAQKKFPIARTACSGLYTFPSRRRCNNSSGGKSTTSISEASSSTCQGWFPAGPPR